MTMGAAWKFMGASGRQAGVEARVADLSTQEPRPAMARMLPAGTAWASQRRGLEGGGREV